MESLLLKGIYNKSLEILRYDARFSRTFEIKDDNKDKSHVCKSKSSWPPSLILRVLRSWPFLNNVVILLVLLFQVNDRSSAPYPRLPGAPYSSRGSMRVLYIVKIRNFGELLPQ